MSQITYKFCSKEFYHLIYQKNKNGYVLWPLTIPMDSDKINVFITKYCSGYCKKICKVFCTHDTDQCIDDEVYRFLVDDNSRKNHYRKNITDILKIFPIYHVLGRSKKYIKYNRTFKEIDRKRQHLIKNMFGEINTYEEDYYMNTGDLPPLWYIILFNNKTTNSMPNFIDDIQSKYIKLLFPSRILL